jgi:hypothetical protein
MPLQSHITLQRFLWRSTKDFVSAQDCHCEFVLRDSI